MKRKQQQPFIWVAMHLNWHGSQPICAGVDKARVNDKAHQICAELGLEQPVRLTKLFPVDWVK